jgi:hypothetical protein
MGNTFYIYSRNKDSHRWESDYLAGDENLVKKFKHAIFCFGLGVTNSESKALYFYVGRKRLIKALATEDKKHIILTFTNEAMYDEYNKAEEQMISMDIALQERQFANRFKVSNEKIVLEDATIQMIYTRK